MRSTCVVDRLLLFVVGPHSADPGAKNDTGPIPIKLFRVDSCALDRHVNCRDRILREEVHPVGCFAIDEIEWVESFDLRRDFRFIVAGIEVGDRTDTTLSRE